MSKPTKVHPAAEMWPMLPEPDLRRLAADIAENGLRFPIVLDSDGLVLDGKNRLAACKIAGVEPEYTTYDGDPVPYVLSANNERNHLSMPERAAATALTLATDGKRENGRWEYGALKGTEPHCQDHSNSSWRTYMSHAGLVYDYLGAERLKRVAQGREALDAAVKQAKKERELQGRLDELPDDLRALVDAGELTIPEADRRSNLSDRYAQLVASGDINLEEAEQLNDRDEREHRESIARAVSAIESFLHGWPIASNLKRTASRDEILAALPEYDRKQFLKIEEELGRARGGDAGGLLELASKYNTETERRPLRVVR